MAPPESPLRLWSVDSIILSLDIFVQILNVSSTEDPSLELLALKWISLPPIHRSLCYNQIEQPSFQKSPSRGHNSTGWKVASLKAKRHVRAKVIDSSRPPNPKLLPTIANQKTCKHTPKSINFHLDCIMKRSVLLLHIHILVLKQRRSWTLKKN